MHIASSFHYILLKYALLLLEVVVQSLSVDMRRVQEGGDPSVSRGELGRVNVGEAGANDLRFGLHFNF